MFGRIVDRFWNWVDSYLWVRKLKRGFSDLEIRVRSEHGDTAASGPLIVWDPYSRRYVIQFSTSGGYISYACVPDYVGSNDGQIEPRFTRIFHDEVQLKIK